MDGQWPAAPSLEVTVQIVSVWGVKGPVDDPDAGKSIDPVMRETASRDPFQDFRTNFSSASSIPSNEYNATCARQRLDDALAPSPDRHLIEIEPPLPAPDTNSA